MGIWVNEVRFKSEAFGEENTVRLRSRFCVLFGLLAAGVVLFLATVLKFEVASTAAWLAKNSVWMLFPLMATILGLAAYFYLKVGRFLKPYSDDLARVSVLIGLALALLVSIFVSKLGLSRSVSDLVLGGWWGIGVSLAILLLAPLVLRRTDLDLIHELRDQLVPILSVVAIVIFTAAHVLLKTEPWQNALSVIWGMLDDRWAILATPLAVFLFMFELRRVSGRVALNRPESESVVFGLQPKLLVLGSVVGALATYAILYEMPILLVNGANLAPADYVNALVQERRTLLAVLGAIGASITLVYTHFRHQLARDANATGRYSVGVEQLGNESMSIRLGGIYALARVARDSPSDAKTITKVFAAFIRGGSPDSQTESIALDIQAAMHEVAEIHGRYPNTERDSIDLSFSKLAGGRFENVVMPETTDLSNSVLAGASFEKARLSKTNFSSAILQEINLSGIFATQCDFADADCSEANFKEANLSFSLFRATNCRSASFRNATLRGSVIYKADFSKANLQEANFECCDLRGTDFTDANLKGANLSYALLDGAIGLSKEMLQSVSSTSEAVFGSPTEVDLKRFTKRRMEISDIEYGDGFYDPRFDSPEDYRPFYGSEYSEYGGC